MVKILINGANGRMGKKVREIAGYSDEITVVCGVDRVCDFSDDNFPVYDDIEKIKEKPDVVIDFSTASALSSVLSFATKKHTPVVLCSTGYTENDLLKINEASKAVAIFRSANMSIGVNVLINLVKKAATTLEGFDIEIVEKHHNKKIDAPSGTAMMIANGIKDVLPEKIFTYGRNGIVGNRNPDEIGIHAIRGGNIVGEHEVIFAGENEVITLTHSAADRSVFASGAIRAAKFISNKQNGLFDMNDLLDNIND